MPKPRTGLPARLTLIEAWQEMRETWHRQQQEPDYYFDTPVPPAKSKKSRTADAPASSIGDLAPKGLR